MVDAVNQIELLRAQLAGLKPRSAQIRTRRPSAPQPTNSHASWSRSKTTSIQLKATGRGQDTVRWTPKLMSKIGYLANEVESSDYQPTTQQVAVHDELKEQAATYRSASNSPGEGGRRLQHSAAAAQRA